MKLKSLPLALLGGIAWAQSPVSLQDAERIGLENSPAVKIARSQTTKATQQTRQALGLLGFRLDAQADYQRFFPANQFGPGSGSHLDSKRLNLQLSYPIDAVGLFRKAARAASFNEQANRDGITVEEIAVRNRIRTAYFGALRAQEAVTVRQEALKATQDTLDNLQKRFAEGDIPRFDVLRLETEVSRANADLLTSQNDFVLAVQALNNAMSQAIDTPIALQRVDGMPSLPPVDADLVALAHQERPELKQLNNFLVARRFFTTTERGGLSPSLNLGARHSISIDPGPFERENQTVLTATLSLPIFDSGITRARVRAAKEDEVQVEQNIEQTKLGISLQVKSSLARLRNARDQIRVAEKTRDLQKEAFRLARLRYENQVGILLDVTVARADLTLAEFGLLNARYEYLTAYAALQQAVGKDDLPTETAQ